MNTIGQREVTELITKKCQFIRDHIYKLGEEKILALDETVYFSQLIEQNKLNPLSLSEPQPGETGSSGSGYYFTFNFFFKGDNELWNYREAGRFSGRTSLLGDCNITSSQVKLTYRVQYEREVDSVKKMLQQDTATLKNYVGRITRICNDFNENQLPVCVLNAYTERKTELETYNKMKKSLGFISSEKKKTMLIYKR